MREAQTCRLRGGQQGEALAFSLPWPLQDGLFALREVDTLPNPVVLRNLATLSDILNCQSYLRSALHAANMLQAAGLKMDTILYTNLIKGG